MDEHLCNFSLGEKVRSKSVDNETCFLARSKLLPFFLMNEQ